MKRTPMKRRQPKRDWSRAQEKLEAEGACRVCGSPNVEAAHVIGREHDSVPPPRWEKRGEWQVYGYSTARLVLPEAIVPLCAQVGSGCHARYDAHELDLLPHLTLDEQERAVRDAGGLVAAYERTTGHQWKAEAA